MLLWVTIIIISSTGDVKASIASGTLDLMAFQGIHNSSYGLLPLMELLLY